MRRHQTGLDALRLAVAEVLCAAVPRPSQILALGPASPSSPYVGAAGPLFAQVAGVEQTAAGSSGAPGVGTPSLVPDPDHHLASSSAADEGEQQRLIGLVELARAGDKEAFGLLYDHYHASVYRFVYYRVGSVQLAEDLTGETFLRALRAMNGFRWQGRDFGAWLTTIARNLTLDHFKSGRARLEQATDDPGSLDSATEGPEESVLASLTNQALLDAVRRLPRDQRDCLVLRFLQGRSLAETAEALGRSTGAVKQLQLRGVRNLADLLPEGLGR